MYWFQLYYRNYLASEALSSHCINTCVQDKALWDAAHNGDVSEVKRLIATNANVDFQPLPLVCEKDAVAWC